MQSLEASVRIIGRRISVVVPIYGNKPLLERVVGCLERETSRGAGRALVDEVLLINDKPDDVETAEYLRTVLESSTLPVKLLPNEKNLGFVGSVNRGFAAARPGNHILLLNTDTIFFEGFFDRLEKYLQSLAKAPYRWASLTPATNNGTIATVPTMCREYSDYENLSQPSAIAGLCTTIFQDDDEVLEIPVGVGFCMLMNRLVLDEVGYFDEAFSPGYGEEVDWCLRSSLRGHKHFFLPGIFVHHDGGASFSEAKKKLVESHNRMITARYPAFDQSVQHFVAARQSHRFHDVLKPFVGFLSSLRNRRVIVHLLHTDLLRRMGGSEKYVRDVNEYLLQERGISSICLSPHIIDDEQYVSMAVDGRQFGTLSVDSLFYLLTRLIELNLLTIESFTLQHTMNWLSTEIDRVVDFFSGLTVNRSMIVHDFYLVCSQYNLLYNDTAYCGAPDKETSHFCSTCSYGSNLAAHRNRSRELLSKFNRVVAPSQSTAAVLKRIFPESEQSITVRPHLQFAEPAAARHATSLSDERIRCIYLGVPTAAKGRYRYESLAKKFRNKFEWITVGAEAFLPLEISAKHIHYNFLDGDRSRPLLAPLAPGFVILASSWPETFSYTLHEALEAGLPVLTTAESGNIADVVRSRGCGKVFGTFADLEEYLARPTEDCRADILQWSREHTTTLNVDAIVEIYVGATPLQWPELETVGLAG